MATENYGSYGELGKSQAITPVSTDTVLIGIGACSGGDLNKPYVITSVADYASQLDGAVDDGFNLSELVVAAFQVANINKIIIIPVSHTKAFTQADYLGNAGLFTGVYAIESYLRNNPSTVNLVVAPGVTDSTVLAALNGVCLKADGHWQSYMIYDLPENADQINTSNIAIPADIVEDKQLSSDHARAVWGHIKTSGGYIISGAAVQACVMARTDADYGDPERNGGNLALDGIISPCISYEENSETVIKLIEIPESIGNQLSADGVCSWINYGGGNWRTWGDHTSAYSSGTISDEVGRFDNTIRMNMMVLNRFQLKYRFSIDNPMDLSMRNDIIDEELTFLNRLVAKGALIGEPKVEFLPVDNSIDNIQRGEFRFTIATTPTIPAKYLFAKVVYTTVGLSVYYTTGE
jgi:hypothetical protein